MLETTGLHSGYGRIPILRGISMAVAEGEFVGILGHNGMGKTTLLKTIIGIVQAAQGQIHFDGTEVTRWTPHARVRCGLGYVPQGRQIFPGLTTLDNLRMGTTAQGRSKDVVEDVLTDFPRLRPLLDRLGGALSGGEQQMLAIARCLCAEPKLILLDEPTEGLQPSIIEEIIVLLRQLRDKRGLTLVLVEQNLNFIKALANRVLLLQRGEITQEIAADQLSDPEVMGEFIGIAG